MTDDSAVRRKIVWARALTLGFFAALPILMVAGNAAWMLWLEDSAAWACLGAATAYLAYGVICSWYARSFSAVTARHFDRSRRADVRGDLAKVLAVTDVATWRYLVAWPVPTAALIITIFKVTRLERP